MYIAMLFDEQDQLLAAAPACDQQPWGDRYWREQYPQTLPTEIGQTAVLHVANVEHQQLLLSLANDPGLLADCRACCQLLDPNARAYRTARAA